MLRIITILLLALLVDGLTANAYGLTGVQSATRDVKYSNKYVFSNYGGIGKIVIDKSSADINGKIVRATNCSNLEFYCYNYGNGWLIIVAPKVCNVKTIWHVHGFIARQDGVMPHDPSLQAWSVGGSGHISYIYKVGKGVSGFILHTPDGATQDNGVYMLMQRAQYFLRCRVRSNSQGGGIQL